MKRHVIDAASPLTARMLAGELERRCVAGISLRVRGLCVDTLAGQHSPRERKGQRQRKRHKHDAGCRALGVSLRGLRRFLRAADRVGAAALLDEAVTAATTEIDAWGAAAWESQAAVEAVCDAIRSRSTPR